MTKLYLVQMARDGSWWVTDWTMRRYVDNGTCGTQGVALGFFTGDPATGGAIALAPEWDDYLLRLPDGT